MKNRWLMRGMLVLACLAAIPIATFAETREEPRSFSWGMDAKALQQVQQKALPAVEAARLLAQDRENAKDLERPSFQRFGVVQEVSLTLKNSGTWQRLADGRLWRLRVHSPGALSQNLGFTRFDMPPGAKLWVYDPGHQRFEGPYSATHKSDASSLTTPLIAGDEIVVELYVPSRVRTPDLEITTVGQGYRPFLGINQDKIPNYASPDWCEIDVECANPSVWYSNQRRAVGVYHVTVGMNLGYCTGTMLNSDTWPKKNYFLSAHHCGVTAGNAGTVVTYWNYESPTCGPHTHDPIYDTQAGSTFRASRSATAGSDFLLLELSNTPPSNIYFSGWDASNTAPSSATCIHHPNRGVKSISYAGAMFGTVAGGFTPSAGNYWFVPWTSGVTEGGSSGSCIWDDATQRCVGQLLGGLSACSAPPSDMVDWYGKFSVSYNAGPTAATRLQDWLDPNNLGLTYMDGDPHLTTLDNTRYDFQGAGEYVALRDSDGTEIQARMSPVSTTWMPTDPYDGLTTCASINTAIAARVGGHRVTIQPNLSGVPDPSGLQVRVDGVLTSLGSSPLAVGAGRIQKTSASSYEIVFPNGTTANVTSNYWSSQGTWYLNLTVFQKGGSGGYDPRGGAEAPDTAGLLAPLAPGSWLPAMPNGSSLGAMPATLNQRYNTLYSKFGNAWRVGSASLFDYAPGTSTATFTYNWPPKDGPCIVPEKPVAKPFDIRVARELCRTITGELNESCVVDVQTTGERGFVTLYEETQKIRNGATFTTVAVANNPAKPEEPAVLVANVGARRLGKETPALQGTVQFFLDDREFGEPVPLKEGQARVTLPRLDGDGKVSAVFVPKEGSIFLTSTSGTETVSLKTVPFNLK